jgi:mRNA interferase MazF
VVRGEVFHLRSPRGRRGSEQAGQRFAVVVQADELLVLSMVLVAPTSRSAPPRSFRPAIEIAGQPTRVLVEQTTAVIPDRLGDSAGRLSARELSDVDTALALVFGL